MNNSPDYIKGFFEGKIKPETNINQAVSYLNNDIEYCTILDKNGAPTTKIIIDIAEFKKIIDILKK